MDTHLAIKEDRKDDRIWLDALNLAAGDFGRLKIGKGEMAVRPQALMGSAYGNLVEFLCATHEVIPFPYDWRKDIREEAERFGKALEEKLKQTTDQPIRIVAHSAGWSPAP